MNATSTETPLATRHSGVYLLVAILVLQAAHLAVLFLSPKPALYSDYAQLVFQFAATAICLRQRAATIDSTMRLRWLAVGSAFCIWAVAQSWFIMRIYHPNSRLAGLHVDDALWVLFGLPLLLVNYINGDEKVDKIQLLDRAQATLFFTVLYLLIFLPSIKLRFATAYNIQDLALVLCGLLRLPTCKSGSERRFYARLNLFLLAYGACMCAAHALYAKGWQDGSLADLFWTLPITFFFVSVLRDELWPSPKAKPGRLVLAARNIQGLGITVLAFSSLGLSAVLANHNLLVGGTVLILAFGLFAFRMNARERAWYRAHCRLEESVLQDALTGLGNRLLLRNKLAERLSKPLANEAAVLLFIDLDRFKGINDSLGHAVGDRLLIEVGERLRTSAPPDAVVSRLGGDEFVVLASASDTAGARGVGEAMLEALHRPFLLGGHTLRCTASIGVVAAQAGASVEDLLRTADHAMYRAKQLGKDRVQLFDDSLLASLNDRWQMEADLRDAVENEAITISFQPIARLKDGSIVGVEALARWTHSKWGQVPPSEFIPLAEETGLIHQLGAQILESSCRQVADWNRAWGTTLSVSVNVSPRQFSNPGLLQEILRSLQRARLDPKLLRLEITESALLVNESTVKQVLVAARAQGIRVALDDFGTGYSSLSYLIQLPVDEIKVDRSFVSEMHRDPQRRELVRAVIHLAHSLGKCVVCEGVENELEVGELSRMECELVQGWIVSKPLQAVDCQAKFLAVETAFAGLISKLRGESLSLIKADEELTYCLTRPMRAVAPRPN